MSPSRGRLQVVTLCNLIFCISAFFFQGITVSGFLLLGIKMVIIHLQLGEDVCPVIGGGGSILAVYLKWKLVCISNCTLLCHAAHEASCSNFWSISYKGLYIPCYFQVCS